MKNNVKKERGGNPEKKRALSTCSRAKNENKQQTKRKTDKLQTKGGPKRTSELGGALRQNHEKPRKNTK